MNQTIPALGTSASQDEADIRELETSLREAWNRHDAKAHASFFSDDADCINVVGWWWKGRPLIEKKVAEAHVLMFRESIVTDNEIHFRFLTSEVAVVHIRWSMVGNRNPDGTPGTPRRGIQTHVLQKQSGRWWIVAFNNVDSIPEIPFPARPPTT
jgi:uncharacterized protein (TIGR02246 family)